MGSAVDYGQIQNLIALEGGKEATWAFAWDLDAAHYASVDTGLINVRLFDPRNPGRWLPQSVERVRTWTEIDDAGVVWIYVTFRNHAPTWAYLLPSLIRVPNKT